MDQLQMNLLNLILQINFMESKGLLIEIDQIFNFMKEITKKALILKS